MPLSMMTWSRQFSFISFPGTQGTGGTLEITVKLNSLGSADQGWRHFILHNPILDTRISFRSSVRTSLRLCYPPWILKRGGLESYTPTLISSIGKTKRIAFFLAFFCCWNFQICSKKSFLRFFLHFWIILIIKFLNFFYNV